MNNTTAIFLVYNDKVRPVRVSYEAEPNKHNPNNLFKTFDQTIKVGDFVVVPTATRWGATVCRVEEVDFYTEINFDGPIDYDWIITKVDKTEYQKTVEAEKQIIIKVTTAQANRRRQQLAEDLGIGSVDLSAIDMPVGLPQPAPPNPKPEPEREPDVAG